MTIISGSKCYQSCKCVFLQNFTTYLYYLYFMLSVLFMKFSNCFVIRVKKIQLDYSKFFSTRRFILDFI